MNGRQQFHINQMTSRDAIRAAEAHRIARIATQDRPNFAAGTIERIRQIASRTDQNGNSMKRESLIRNLRVGVAVIGLLVVLLFVAAPSYAQETSIVMNDFGASEAYHESYVLFRVAYYHQIKGEHEQAVAEFTEAVEGLPTFVEGYAARGDSYFALGDFESAIFDYTTAIGLDPGFVSVLYTRGSTYAVLGLDDLARADFENAIAQMPEYSLPYRGMGDLHYAVGATNLALDFYRVYVELSPESPDAQVMARIGELQVVLAADNV